MNKDDVIFAVMLAGALIWAGIIAYFIYKEFKHPTKGKSSGSPPPPDYSGYSDNFS